jgi:hypothetical protein
MLYHISGSSLTVGSPREACRAVEAVNHITELLIDFTDMHSLLLVLPLPWFWYSARTGEKAASKGIAGDTFWSVRVPVLL